MYKRQVLSYADYVAADLDSEVTIESYVQAKQSWWEDKATAVSYTHLDVYKRQPLWTVTGTWEIIILSRRGAMAGMRPKNVVRAAWNM